MNWCIVLDRGRQTGWISDCPDAGWSSSASRVVSRVATTFYTMGHDADRCACSRQDVTHHALHVRLFRQHVPSDDRYRLSLQGTFRVSTAATWRINLQVAWVKLTPSADHVPRGSDRAVTALGYGRARTVQESHTILHTRFECGRRCLRHFQYAPTRTQVECMLTQARRLKVVPEHEEVDRRRSSRAR
jgi:hypothetical protein